jgi:acetolactate synthase I/II/III large subunit
MSSSVPVRSGGQILVDALRVHGADLAFCVPGESYLDVLNAFHDAPDIKLVTCRQEGGAANMAEAHGKLTGRPGICFVTRGPGACNASIGVHTAMQDSSPMILFIGQVARDQEEREAFQEIDYRRMFGPVAKWAAQIDEAERIPEFVSRAFHVATSGRPGPVVLALPEDMLRDRVAVADIGRYASVQAYPGAQDLDRLDALLARASRPIVVAGGSSWSDEAAQDLRNWAEANRLPVCCSFRRQDLMGNDSDSYIGDLGTGPNPKLLENVRQADLLIVVNARLGEMTTQGYELLEPPVARQTLVHAHASAEELGRVYRPDLAIQAGPVAMVRALASRPAAASQPWADWTAKCRRDYLSWLEPDAFGDYALDLGRVMTSLRERLPADAIVTLDAGNFAGWGQRFLRYGRPGRQLGPTSGAMGYAVPAAVAAKIAHPDRVVLGLVGDGGFMMTGQELATAMQAGAAPVILLFNNGMYGTIRMHQERRYPGRISATDLVNPDFVRLAESYGAFGRAVERTEDFLPALEEALSCGRAAVIELRIDPEVITTRMSLSRIREDAFKAQG